MGSLLDSLRSEDTPQATESFDIEERLNQMAADNERSLLDELRGQPAQKPEPKPLQEQPTQREEERAGAVDVLTREQEEYEEHAKLHDAATKGGYLQDDYDIVQAAREYDQGGEFPVDESGAPSLFNYAARGVSWLFRPLGALQAAALAPMAKKDYKYKGIRQIPEQLYESARAGWAEFAGMGERPNYEKGAIEYMIGEDNYKSLPKPIQAGMESFLAVLSDPAIIAVPFRSTIQKGLARSAAQGRAPRIFSDTLAEMYSFVEATPQQAKTAVNLAKKADKGDAEAAKKLGEMVDENIQKQIRKAQDEQAKLKRAKEPTKPKKKTLKKPEAPKPTEKPKAKIQKVADLRKKAAELKIPGRSKMKRAELEAAIQEKELTQEAEAAKGFEAPKKKTKSFSEKEVKGALEEADVKKPAVINETEMSGDDFLNLTTGSDKRKQAIIDKIKKGDKKLTKGKAPILVVDKNGKVIAHDGRHRAAAAAQQGENVKTLIVSEDEAFKGGKIESQKFGSKDREFTVDTSKPAPDLRAGIRGKEITLPVPKVAKKPKTWNKIDTPAVRNTKTGEVLQSKKKFQFKPSERKNVDEVREELNRLRKQMIKRGVDPQDIDNGFVASDDLKFVPTEVQQKKLPVKRALEQTKIKQMKEFDSETRALRKKITNQTAKLKSLGPIRAVHRLVMKDNKAQARAAAKSWWKANPDLRKGLDLADIQQAAEEAVWEHIRRTPVKDLKKYVAGNKQIKSRIGGEINNAAKWMARDYSKELLKQRHNLNSIKMVKKALEEGKLQTPLEFKEGRVSDLSNKQVDELVQGIVDDDMRKAAELGISPEELTEGMEAAPRRAPAKMPTQRDLKMKSMARKTFPKKGRASALGKKELSPRARRKAKKRAFLRQKEAEKRGELIKRTEDDLKTAKQQLEEAKQRAQARQAELRERFKGHQDAKVSKEREAQTRLHEKAEELARKRTIKVEQTKEKLARLKKEADVLREQGLESAAQRHTDELLGDLARADKAERKRLADITKDAAVKQADYLEKKIGELSDKGGHYLDLDTLADIRRTAQKLGKKDLVAEVETLMIKEQQRLEIRNQAKEVRQAGQTELYSGFPLHRIKALLLDPITDAWTAGVDKLGGKAAKMLRNATLRSDVMTHVASGVLEDFGLSKAYKVIRREFDGAVHRWSTVANDHAQAIQKINGDFKTATREIKVSKRAAQLRARQVAGGSITSFNDKFAAVHKASRRFERLEKMLQERGLLKDHQFKRLNRVERAKVLKQLRQYEDDFNTTMQKLVNLKKDDPRLKIKTRELTDKLRAIENRRIELTTRLQIHYKNSGKNYFRVLYNRLKRQQDAMIRFKKMKMQKRWAIRRDNWKVELNDKGHVIVKQQGKPLKMKEANLSRMINKGISEEAKDAFLYDLFGRIKRSGRWTRASAAKGYKRMPNDIDAWGPLAGQYVHIPVYRELMSTYKEMGTFEKFLQRSMGVWKAGKVVWSPRAQVRNFLSNIILGDILADVNFSTALPRHLNSIRELAPVKLGKKTDNPLLKAFKLDTTLMKTSFAENEIRDAMRWLDPTKLTTEGSKWDALGNAFNKAVAGPTKLYSLIEEGMKFTIFKNEIKKQIGKRSLESLTKREYRKVIRQAEKAANYALFDYSKVPPVIRWARHGYSPFITFTYKAIPRLAKQFFRKPWKAFKWMGGIMVIQRLFDEMSGDSREEIEAERKVLPSYAQRNMLPGQPSHLRLPGKDKEGRSRYFDLSFIIPWGDITEGTGDLSFGSRSIMPNNPIWNLYADFKANEDIFLEKPLTYKHDTGGEVAIKYMKHAWKAVAPGIVDPSSVIKMKRALFNEKDYRGRDYSVAEAVFDAFLGLKIRKFDYMEEATRRFKELEETEADVKLEFMREYNRITTKENLSPEEQDKQMMDLFLDAAQEANKLTDRGFYLLNMDDDE